jgi:capsular polysaccharide export protein
MKLLAYAFPRWKRRFVRRCFAGDSVRFVAEGAPLPVDADGLLLWGMRAAPAGCALPVRRLEDGFLRSVGLGAELVRPLSWVVDDTGIYYDATRPSGLEQILANFDFDAALLARARAFRERVVGLGLTKYNVGATPWQRPAGGQRVILVVGQVESDASLAYGAPGICTNLGLLQAVRAAHPGDWVVYKPHPDVVAGLRRQGAGEGGARAWCDEIVLEAAMGELLSCVDEVHCMTSLAGFEALLRGKLVHCHGLPFYAGWGLTVDALPCPRRGRRLSLDELVAGTLLCYPSYIGPRGPVSAEAALEELERWKARRGGKTRWWQAVSRVFLRAFIGVR